MSDDFVPNSVTLVAFNTAPELKIEFQNLNFRTSALLMTAYCRKKYLLNDDINTHHQYEPAE